MLLIGALARPQVPHEVRQVRSKARNIMLALDISSSMKATDFKPGNRLEVARAVLAEFARRRRGDLMGLVIFAGRSFLQAPLTPDTDLLGEMLGRVDIGQLPDGTAIGTALALALSQLKDLPNRASAIVLITDGANNTGSPTPFVAAEAAHAVGVRIHTIGVSAPDSTGFNDGFVWRQGRTPGSAHQLRRAGAPADRGPERRQVLPRDRSRGAHPDHGGAGSAGARGGPHQRDPRLPRALRLAAAARTAAARGGSAAPGHPPPDAAVRER